MGICAGWGRLRYFDLGERQISYKTTLANIPKLGFQWKVIHDFKPTAYLTDDNCNGCEEPGTIRVKQSQDGIDLGDIIMTFPVGEECVRLFLEPVPEDGIPLPEVGQWTRVELTQEFDENEGSHFLSLSFAGVEVIRAENYLVEGFGHGDLMDMHIELGECNVQIPGFIRRLIVLEKS